MSAAREPEYRDGHGFIAEVIRTRRRKSADIRVEEGAGSVGVQAQPKPAQNGSARH